MSNQYNGDRDRRMTSSQEEMQQQIHGMDRSLSGRTSLPTPRNSIMFDEESFEPILLDVHNSGGEVLFEPGGESADRFVDVATSSRDLIEKNGGYWSPKMTQGYEAEHQDEKWKNYHQNRSDVWRFSEEEGELEASSENTTSSCTTSIMSSQSSQLSLATTPKAVDLDLDDTEESIDNCCMDCGEGFCKMQKLVETGFPSFAPGLGWGGFGPYGFPMPMHQPGVPLTNLNDTQDEEEEQEEENDDDDDEGCGGTRNRNKMRLMKEAGINLEAVKRNKKVMLYVEKDKSQSEDDDDSDKSSASSRASTAMSSDFGHSTITEQTSVTSTTDRKLLSCADGLESDESAGEEEADILAAIKAKKELADDAIAKALPLKDVVVAFFEEGKFSGREVDTAINSYNEAFEGVKTTVGEWRAELKKLDIDADDEYFGLDSTEDLKKNSQVKAPPPAAACESVKILSQLNAKVAGLFEKLPINEFSRMSEFIAFSESQKRTLEREKEHNVIKAKSDEESKKELNKSQEKSKTSCASFGDTYLMDDKSKKKRKKVIESLTKKLNNGPRKHTQIGDFDRKTKKGGSSVKSEADSDERGSEFTPLSSGESRSNYSRGDSTTNNKAPAFTFQKPRSVYDVPKPSHGVAQSKLQSKDVKRKRKYHRIPDLSPSFPHPSTAPVTNCLLNGSKKPLKSFTNLPISFQEQPLDPMRAKQMRERRVRLGLEQAGARPLLGLRPSSIAPRCTVIKRVGKKRSDDDFSYSKSRLESNESDKENREHVTAVSFINERFEDLKLASSAEKTTGSGRRSKAFSFPLIDSSIRRRPSTSEGHDRIRTVHRVEPSVLPRFAAQTKNGKKKVSSGFF